MKKSNSPKNQEKPATIAGTSPESSKSSGDALESSAMPSGVALIKKYKSEGMNVKDAFAAATKLNAGIKESSFKAGWYKKDVATGSKKGSRGRKPGSKNKIKAATPVKEAAVSTSKTSKPVKMAAIKNVDRSASSLSASTKKLVVDALRAQIVELENAIKELGH